MRRATTSGAARDGRATCARSNRSTDASSPDRTPRTPGLFGGLDAEERGDGRAAEWCDVLRHEVDPSRLRQQRDEVAATLADRGLQRRYHGPGQHTLERAIRRSRAWSAPSFAESRTSSGERSLPKSIGSRSTALTSPYVEKNCRREPFMISPVREALQVDERQALPPLCELVERHEQDVGLEPRRIGLRVEEPGHLRRSSSRPYGGPHRGMRVAVEHLTAYSDHRCTEPQLPSHSLPSFRRSCESRDPPLTGKTS